MTKEAMTAELHRIVGEATKGLLTSDQVNEAIKNFEKDNGLEGVKSILDTQKDTIQKQDEAIKNLTDEIVKLKENATSSAGKGIVKGQIVKFFEDNLNAGRKAGHRVELDVKAADVMQLNNSITPVGGADGFSPLWGNDIDDEISSVPKPMPFVLSVAGVRFNANVNQVLYNYRFNEEGDAEFRDEGEVKALIDAEYGTEQVKVKNVAEIWKTSTEYDESAPELVVDFREHANDLIELKIDDALLTGDTTANPKEPNGVTTLASAFIVPPSLANYYDDANIWDAISAIKSQIKLANFRRPQTVALNTVWEAKMFGIKNADGDYIRPEFAARDMSVIQGVNVIFTNQVDEGTIIQGDWSEFKVVLSKNITYDETNSNEDDFKNNLLCKRLEARLATYIKPGKEGAIVADDIDTILTQIEKTVTP